MAYYLGNGSRMPKRADYMKEFGWSGDMYYTLDKLNYQKALAARKEAKENNRRAAEHCFRLDYVKRSDGRIFQNGKELTGAEYRRVAKQFSKYEKMASKSEKFTEKTARTATKLTRW